MQGEPNCAGSRSPHAGGKVVSARLNRRAVGLIPAAGRSRRFGTDKLGTLVSGKPLIVHVATAFLQATSVHEVFVVTRADRTDLKELLEPHGVRVLLLSEPTPDMRATVEEGMKRLEALGELSDPDALLITPADVLGITPELLDLLVHASCLDPHALYVPLVQGRRAHPLLMPWSARRAVYALPPNTGLNELLSGTTVRVREITIDGVRQFDLDMPRDLKRLHRAGSDPAPP